MVEEIDLEKCNFWNFRKKPGDLDLDLDVDRVIRHTVVHHSSTSIYTPNFIEIGKTYCGQTDLEKCNFGNFRKKPDDLDLDLDVVLY